MAGTTRFNDEYQELVQKVNEGVFSVNSLKLDQKVLEQYGTKLRQLVKDLTDEGIKGAELEAKVRKSAIEFERKFIKDTKQKLIDEQYKSAIKEYELRKKSEKEIKELREKWEKASNSQKLEIYEAEKKQLEEQRKDLIERKRIISQTVGVQSDDYKDVVKQLDEVNERYKDNNDRYLENKEALDNAKAAKDKKQLLDERKQHLQEIKDKQTLLKEEKELQAEEASQRIQNKEGGLLSNVKSMVSGGTDFSSLKNPMAWAQKITGAILDGIKKIGDAADKAFQEAEETLNSYQAKISTRLEGSGRQYTDISKALRDNLSLSAIVEQKKVLENVGHMVEQGIAYDLEQRAFLQTVSQEISSTFDAFDSNLLRIIRIQREDSTYARMGLETSLSRLFNEYFLDSSYLTNMYDQVSASLIDATSQLTTAQSAEFEYIVQKWLGALYSMGASESFVTQIASGINMLGTGNVQGLAGSPMQTLFAMAANRSSTDYATLLTNGLDSSNINELMKSMIEYLAEISGNTQSNKVVAGAYSSLFNMTLSDMKAVQNLSSDIKNLYEETIAYNEMAGITQNRIETLGENYTLGKKIQTLFNNLMFSSAQGIVEDKTSYMIYKITDLVGKVGDAVIPTVSVLGNSINLGGTLTDLIKGGIFGVSMIGKLITGLNHQGDENALYNWTTQGEMRGSGYNLTTRNSISQSYAMNSSSADIEYQTLSTASKEAKSKSKTINGNEEEESEITIEDLFYGLFSERSKEGALSAINKTVTEINTMLTSNYVADANAQRVIVTGFNIDSSQSLIEFPVRFGQVGNAQVNEIAANSVSSIKGADEATLYSLLAVIFQTLAENGAFNVNLLSSSLPLTDLVTGRGTPETTKQPPSGNSLSVPQTSARRTANRAASVLDYNVNTYY